MATIVNFHGKNYIEPGAYAVSVYNPTSVVNVSQFGNVMIIDTGLAKDDDGYEFAGGSGIHGELNKGLKSVYQFENYEDFLAFMHGGLMADIAEKIFTPLQGVLGAPKVYYCRAATTKAAKFEIGGIKFTCKNEGIVGNAKIVDGALKAGYAAQIISGENDPSKFILQVFRGNYMGTDEHGEAFGATTKESAKADLIAESPEYSTVGELFTWARRNVILLANFKIEIKSAEDTPLTLTEQVNATGGTTEWMKDSEYADALEAISEMDITFFLCLNLTAEKGTDPATNGKIFTYLKQTAKYTEFMFVPGGTSDYDLFGESGTSESIAKFYNSEQVVVVHGSPITNRKDGNGTKQLNPIYLTAAVMGLNAGMAAQTPLTLKRVGYQSFVYDLKKREREKALQAGILHMRNVSGYWCVNQGITTLQDNEQTYSPDGQTMELSVALIKSQLNKEMMIEAENRFNGNTIAQATPESVKNFVETKLQSLIAYPGNDNLILDWKNVKVSAKNSDYFVTYDFVPNLPINKVFFTGNALDFNLSV